MIHYKQMYITIRCITLPIILCLSIIALPSCSDSASSYVPSWTIMVYMDGDNNLEPYALADFNEMEQVDTNGHTINVIVLLDRCNGETTADGDWKGTRLYNVLHDTSSSKINSERLADSQYLKITNTGDSDELNMGDPDTLSNFISFGKENYPADYYSLILWDHGSGWRSTNSATLTASEHQPFKAVCIDATSANDMLLMSEVKQALFGKGLTLIGFDACLMSMVEVAYQLKDCAHYMVASEEVELAIGWYYANFLNYFIASGRSPIDLGQSIIDAYALDDYYPMSLVDLSSIEAMAGAIDALSSALIYNLSAIKDTISTARDNTLAFQSSETQPYSYIDLYDFLLNISSVNEVFYEVNDAMNAVKRAVLYHYHGNYTRSNGLSIYFPQSDTDSEYSDYNTSTIDFAQTMWDDFLTAYFQ